MKYKAINEVKAYIKGSFTMLTQYRKWVLDNDMVSKGFPLNPNTSYAKSEYKNVDTFLGNPSGTNIKARSEQAKKSRFWLVNNPTAARNYQRTGDIVPSPEVERLSIVDVCKELLERKLSLNTMKSIMSETEFTIAESKQIITLLLDYSNKKTTV